MKETPKEMLCFKAALDTMAVMLHKKQPRRDELRKMWDLLKSFSFEQITGAIDTWLLKDNNFMPSPGELATIIKNSTGQETGELKSIKELQDIKNKFGTIDTETYGNSYCHKCGDTGQVILEQKEPPYYGMAFACNCWKGVPKSKHMETFTEGLMKGYDWPHNINYKKKENDNESAISKPTTV